MNARRIGYARVSTLDQRLDVQLEALRASGCDQVIEETASGADRNRPGLEQALQAARAGDTIVVHRIDRLGRSLAHLVQVLDELRERGVMVQSLSEGLDTGTPAGRMVLGVLGSVAQYELELRAERQRAGIEVAKRRGAYRGRKPKLTPEQQDEARKMVAAGRSRSEVARIWGVSRWTIQRLVAQAAQSGVASE